MQIPETPYEYYEGTLGVKVLWLVSDETGKKKKHPNSLSLIKYRSLSHRMKSKTCIEKQLRAGSWASDALIEFDSLCREWKNLLETEYPKPKEQAKKTWFVQQYERDDEAYHYFLAHRFGANNEKKLAPDVIEIYTCNASVLNTVIRVKTNRKAYKKALGDSSGNIWKSLSRDVNEFREVSHDLPSTPDTLRHKVKKYEQLKYDAIISKKYGKRNRAKVVLKEQMVLIEELLKKHQNLNNEQVAWHYNQVAKRVAGWKEITAGTIATYREKYGFYTYAGRRGLREFDHNVAMQVKRVRPSLPMIYWTADGWNAELLYQKKELNSKGHYVTTYHNRLTAVMILDPFNDYIIGYSIGTHETPALIRDALKNAVNHTKELFGERYKPYQLQTDNYQKSNLDKTYKIASKHFTPAKVGNAKSKVIEPFFDKFNKEYFQKGLAPNWSGHNINSKKDNQPNTEYLSKIKHQFPDELGAKMQLIYAIEKDRAKKIQEYKSKWLELPEQDRTVFPINEFLRTFGKITGYTNKLTGNGVTPTIGGRTYFYESFDENFRKYMHMDWCLYYDETDLSQVLAVNAKSRNGKLLSIIDTIEFILEEKYMQPMALYDRKDGDSEQLQKVFDFNKKLKADVVEHGKDHSNIIWELYKQNPELEMLQKILITNSIGQYKDMVNAARLKQEPKLKEPVTTVNDFEIVDDFRQY